MKYYHDSNSNVMWNICYPSFLLSFLFFPFCLCLPSVPHNLFPIFFSFFHPVGSCCFISLLSFLLPHATWQHGNMAKVKLPNLKACLLQTIVNKQSSLLQGWWFESIWRRNIIEQLSRRHVWRESFDCQRNQSERPVPANTTKLLI